MLHLNLLILRDRTDILVDHNRWARSANHPVSSIQLQYPVGRVNFLFYCITVVMQYNNILRKFKKILARGINILNIKVVSANKPLDRIFLNFLKITSFRCAINSHAIKKDSLTTMRFPYIVNRLVNIELYLDLCIVDHRINQFMLGAWNRSCCNTT